MQYRKDRKTGNDLSVLGFGCMRFPPDLRESERLVVKAVESGVNYFDTAYIYPGSEEKLGRILADNGLRDKINIATKLPIFLCRGGQDFDRFFAKQLERLKTDYIDYYLLHNISDMSQWEKLRGWGVDKWLDQKKAGGAIRRAGFSFHGAYHDFESLIDAYDWDFCQIQYNYSDENYQAGVSGLRKAAEKGLSVVIMEPLLGGKLADRLPPKAAEVFKKADPSLSPAAWALRWLWNQPEVTVVLSGMNAESQLLENIETSGGISVGGLNAGEKAAFEEVRLIFRKLNKIPCTGCRYCMPCPQHVNIPACFAAYNASFSIDRAAGLQQYRTSTAPTSDRESGAGRCIGCGKCERHCPQNIKIRERLKLVRKRLEPWWYSAFLKAGRFALGLGGKSGK